MRKRVGMVALLLGLAACSEYADDPLDAPGVAVGPPNMGNMPATGGDGGMAGMVTGGAMAGASAGTVTGGAAGMATGGAAGMASGGAAGMASGGAAGMASGGAAGMASGGAAGMASGGTAGMVAGGSGGMAGMATGGMAGMATGEPAALAGITELHNVERRKLALPDLTWDPALAVIAQAWAQTCTDVKVPTGLLDHNPDRAATYTGSVGENIYGHSAKATAADALFNWIKEQADYDYGTNTCAATKVCGHYTQVVWRNTTKVGCGINKCAGLTYGDTIVCNYSPAGNVVGQKPY